MTPEELLALQRTAGNAALARILARAESGQDPAAWVRERLDDNDLGLLLAAASGDADALEELRAKLEASLGEDASEADRSNAAQRLNEALESVARNDDQPAVNHAETAIVQSGAETIGSNRLGHGAADALTAVKDGGFTSAGTHGGGESGWSVPSSLRKRKRRR
jgi:hypothetical protein